MSAGWTARVWSDEGTTLRTGAWWVVAPLAGVGIALLGISAVYFSPPGASVAIWWPASGLSLALAVVTPRRWFWVSGLIIFVATFVGNTSGAHPHPVDLSLWYAVGNVLEAGVGLAVLTGGFRRPARLATLEDTAYLLIAALAAAATLGVFAGLGIALLTGGDFLRSVQSLTASHAAAHLIIVPVVIAARGGHEVRPRAVESGVQFVATFLITMATYLAPSGLPTEFLPVPFLIWGALRLSTRLLSIELLILGATMVLGTHGGRGPFGAPGALASMSDLTLLLQASILVHALVVIPTVVVADQRRAALRQAHTTSDELSSVLDSSQGLAIIATDASGRVVVWGSGAVAMFGWSREEALATLDGTSLYAEAHRNPMEFLEVAAPLRSGAKVVEGDWEFVRKDGTEFTGHLRLSLRSAPSGEELGFLGVIEDVSQARKTEEALRAALRHEHEAVERLASLDRSKNDFISSVSHELRTPITSVIGYTDLMRAYDLPEEQVRLLEPVVRNAKRLESLIEDLLTVSRMDGGTFVYRPQQVDLRDSVRTAVEGVLVAFGQRRLEVIVNLGDAEITIMGDPDQLERAVSNLASNAVKFTPDGGRIVIGLTASGPNAVITVEDTGMGIPRAEQSKVFDRFFRSAKSSELAIDGTGLGLHIVNEVVAAHGGRVSFESQEGRGSTFRMVLPLREA